LNDTIFLDKTTVESAAKLSNANWPSPRKWDYAQPAPLDVVDREYNDQVLLRVAETYLVLAEANFRLGDKQGAADAINALRTRAHANQVTAAIAAMQILAAELGGSNRLEVDVGEAKSIPPFPKCLKV